MRYHSTEAVLKDLPLMNVHDERQCRDRDCILHSPSRHNLALAPFDIVQGSVAIFMYRMCPHGQSHLDPDALGYLVDSFTKMVVREYLSQTYCNDGKCCGCCGWKD